MNKPRIKTLENGKSYMCTICETVHSGPNCRNRALKCYDSHFILSERIINHAPYNPEPKEPGAGVEYPDQYGHFRRLSPDNPEYNRIMVNKARHFLDQRERNLEKYLDSVLRKLEKWDHSKATPLQRLSYAFYHGRWESVKQAAYALAYSRAVEMLIERLNIPEIIQSTLKLQRLLTEYLVDQEAIDRSHGQGEKKEALDRFLEWLKLQDEINNIEGGENEIE